MPSKSSMAENDHERFTTPTGQQTESTREIDQVVKEHPTLENYLKFMIYIGKELNAHHRTAHIVRYLNTTPRLIKANSPLSFEAQDYARGLYDTILKGPHQERIRYKNIWNEKCSVKYQDMVFAGLNKAKQEEEKGDEIIVRDKDEEDDQDWKTKEEEQLDGWLMDNDIKEHDRNAAAKERGPVENPTEHSGEARIQVENQTEVDSGEARSESKHRMRHGERRSGSDRQRSSKSHEERRSRSDRERPRDSHSERRSRSDRQRRGEGHSERRRETPRNNTQKSTLGTFKDMINDFQPSSFKEPRSEMHSARVSRK